jgi:antitoxin PrlF
MRTVVSEKGQITIPKALRDALGITPGQILDIVEDHGALIGRKVTPADPTDELFGIISLPGGTDEFIADLRGPDIP